MKVVLSSDPAMQNPSSYSLFRYQQRMVRYVDISFTVFAFADLVACFSASFVFITVEVRKYAHFFNPDNLNLIFLKLNFDRVVNKSAAAVTKLHDVSADCDWLTQGKL